MTTPSYEIPSDMREMAEKSVDQARRAFDGFMTAAQKAAGQADTTAASVQSNAKTIGTKAMGFAESNVRGAFDLAQKLVRAKDLQEVLALQSDYAKAQMTTIQDQAKELGRPVRFLFDEVVDRRGHEPGLKPSRSALATRLSGRRRQLPNRPSWPVPTPGPSTALEPLRTEAAKTYRSGGNGRSSAARRVTTTCTFLIPMLSRSMSTDTTRAL